MYVKLATSQFLSTHFHVLFCIQICSHPGVAAYIDGVVEMVRRMLDAGTIQQVAIVLTDTDMKPVEKFTLEIGRCAKGISSSK